MQSTISESRLAELWDLARSKESLPKLLLPEEFKIVEHYQAINGSLLQSWQSAPAKALEMVKAFMPANTRRFSIAHLVRPRPLLGFARGAVSQVQFETEDVQVRIQLEEIPGGWRMWGRTSEPGWSVWSGPSKVACNKDGEFELDVQAESVQPLSLQNESMTILLPLSVDEIGDGHT